MIRNRRREQAILRRIVLLTDEQEVKLEEFKRLMFEAARDEAEGPLPEDMMVIVGVNWEKKFTELRERKEVIS